jgi:hypothetical protein
MVDITDFFANLSAILEQQKILLASRMEALIDEAKDGESVILPCDLYDRLESLANELEEQINNGPLVTQSRWALNLNLDEDRRIHFGRGRSA